MTARARVFAEPGRAALRTIVALAIVTGTVDAPSRVSGQTTPAAPYRVVLPQGPGPHPALLFVSGCSGFAPDVAPDHYSRVAQGFAAQGFVVVFVDYLGARGRKICGGMISPGDVAKDILAAAAYASTQPSVRASDVSVIGWPLPSRLTRSWQAGVEDTSSRPARSMRRGISTGQGVRTPQHTG